MVAILVSGEWFSGWDNFWNTHLTCLYIHFIYFLLMGLRNQIDGSMVFRNDEAALLRRLRSRRISFLAGLGFGTSQLSPHLQLPVNLFEHFSASGLVRLCNLQSRSGQLYSPDREEPCKSGAESRKVEPAMGDIVIVNRPTRRAHSSPGPNRSQAGKAQVPPARAGKGTLCLQS